MIQQEKMKTKDRILEVALVEFNQKGVAQTTVRSIAKAVGISHGNLCYHFKNTDELILALYHQLVEETDSLANLIANQSLNFNTIIELAFQTTKKILQYEFLIKDFNSIAFRLPTIKEHFKKLTLRRNKQFGAGIEHLIHQGLMIEEPTPCAYQILMANFFLVSNHWLSYAKVFDDLDGDQLVHKYFAQIMFLLEPYLTPSGKKQLMNHKRIQLDSWIHED
jgi:AcrR family transcriptional regulator